MKGLSVILFLTLSFFFLQNMQAQERQSAIPQLNSDMREGITNAQNGMLVYDTDTHSFWYFQSGWINLNEVELPTAHTSARQAAPPIESVAVQIQGKEQMRIDSGHLSLMFPDSSTIIGFEAGQLNAELTNEEYDDQGKFNTFLGLQSGYSNNPDPNLCAEYEFFDIYEGGCGSNNTFLGDRTGFSNSIGRNNLFVGSRAGYYNLGSDSYIVGEGGPGAENTFMGFLSGHFNQQGYWNTFVGAYSGEMNGLNSVNESIGINNTYLGTSAGRFNEDGIENVMVGAQAGGYFDNDTGQENVFIGFRSGYKNLGSKNVYVGRSAGEKQEVFGLNERNVLIGHNAGRFLVGSGNVFIGHAAGQNDLAENKLIIGNGPSSKLIEGDFANNIVEVNGNLLVNSNTDASLFSSGPLEVRTLAGQSIVMDGEEILARNGATSANLAIQRDAGQIIVGKTSDITGDKVMIEVGSNIPALRVRQAGATKLRVHSNGGTSFGINSTPPANGILVQGDVKVNGTNISGTGDMTISTPGLLKISANGHLITIDPLGQLTIESSSDVNVIASNNINLTAGNDIVMDAGGDILMAADGRMDLTGGSELELNSNSFIDINANTDLYANSGGRIDLVGNTELELNSNAFIDMNASTNILMDAGIKIDLVGNSELELNSSALIDINSSGIITANSNNVFDITGSLVRLNASGGGLGAARVGSLISNPPCLNGCFGTILPTGSSATVLIGN